jgi:hypothetical protein
MVAGAGGGALICNPVLTGESRTPWRLSFETCWSTAVSKPTVALNFLQALLAIILGNVAYFALLPSLPAAARHRPFRLDLGTVIDFFFCVVAYWLIRTVRKWR